MPVCSLFHVTSPKFTFSLGILCVGLLLLGVSQPVPPAGTLIAYPWQPYPNGPVDPDWLDHAPTCDPDDWLNKYFHYRQRLRGNGTADYPGFVSIGPAAGESLVASGRDPVADCASDWWLNDAECIRLGPTDANGKYGWGDSTILHGFYLAVLATEHAVFTKLGLPSSQTEIDLALALKAFNRLDEAAEIHYGVPPRLDGFYQRADVPAEFIFLPDGRFRFPRAESGINGYGCLGSPTACGVPAIEDGFYVSQDQTIGMLLGLALVEHFIPDSLQAEGLPLRHEARAIAHRIVMSLRENQWMVTDPLGNHPPDKWGGYAIAFSDQIAKAANRIAAPDFGVRDYRNAGSITMGIPIWQAFEASWPVQSDINKSMAVKLAAINNTWTAEMMAQRSADFGSPMFALLQALLQQGKLSRQIALWETESLLSLAPCSGPCHFTPECDEAIRWKGDNLWQNPDHRNGSRYGMRGEYHGLDYLLLHNVYFLYRNGSYSVTPPKIPTSGCESYQGLEKILQNGPSNGQRYDPYQACAAIDLQKRFCNRSFARWLDEAYQGQSTIFTGLGRWSCVPGSPCQITLGRQSGTNGSDLILGTAGNDDLNGGEGNDCLYGLTGNDRLEGGIGRDEIYGGEGNDTIYGDIRGNSVSGDMDLLLGGPGNDIIYAGPGRNDIFGEDGDDQLFGGSGMEYLEGGAGNDVMWGGAGIDIMNGHAGNDEIHGEDGDDSIDGGPGRNKLEGGAGNDGFLGGDDDDFIKGDSGDDTVWAGAGNDRVCGGKGSDFLSCDWGINEYEVEEHPVPGTLDTINWGCTTPIGPELCSNDAFARW